MTQQTWNALPQKTGVSPVTRLDAEKNRVEGHRNVGEHIASVMTWVENHAPTNAKIDIIGMGDASEEVVTWLSSNWSRWQTKIDAVAVGMAWMWGKEETMGWSKGFRDFWGRVSPFPPLTYLTIASLAIIYLFKNEANVQTLRAAWPRLPHLQ